MVKEKVKKDVELDVKIEAEEIEVSSGTEEIDARLKEVEKNLEIAGNTLDKMQENIKNAVDLLNRVAKRMGLE